MRADQTPRRRAIDALESLFADAWKPKQALDSIDRNLEERDRAFLMELVYGVVRHRDCLDWMLSGFLSRPGGLASTTINNLRTAVYQIEFMRVPEWAAVDEAVSIEKAMRGRHGLVNAVLRNFLRNRPALPDPRIDASGKALAVVTSHPLWLVQRWIRRFGLDEAIGLCTANNTIPQTAIRIGDRARRDEALRMLAEKNIVAHASSIVPAGIAVAGTVRFRDLADALAMPYVVQDEAAQLVGYLVNPSPGQRVLDACAAPGGKATHLAELMGDSGEVIAMDLDDARLQMLRETLVRLGLKSVTARVANALTCRDDRQFDHVLVDAPCSALGTIRRNPDIRYRITAADLDRLQVTQQRMLANLARLVRPGGTLVYAVCSTEPEEGEMVIRRFLQEQPDFSIIEGDFPFFEPFACRDEGGFVGYRTFPHRHGMDGFFAVRMKCRP